MRTHQWLRALFSAFLLMGLSQQGIAQQSLLVSNWSGGTIGEYDAATGAPINLYFIPASGKIAADTNGNLFVTRGSSLISQYDASTGGIINYSIVGGLKNLGAITTDGHGNLYISTFDGNIGKYDSSTGQAINPSFITISGHPSGMAVDGNGHLFVTTHTGNTIQEFDANTGAAINTHLVTASGGSGLHGPTEIAVDGNGHLFVVNSDYFNIGEYDANTGATINPAFISASQFAFPNGTAFLGGIALDGNGNLFVARDRPLQSAIGEYNATTGATINASYITITGLTGGQFPQFIAIAPEPSAIGLIALCAAGLFARRRSSFTQIPGAPMN